MTGGGFTLVLESKYLRLVALLVVLLNMVNTTGEYLVARMLTNHVGQLALADPTLDKQAFIGAFSGSYQFWVNVLAFVLPSVPDIAAAEISRPGRRAARTAAHRSRRVRDCRRRRRLLGGAVDQDGGERDRLLGDEYGATAPLGSYKIDTFFVRVGDVLCAGVVYLGTQRLHLDIQQFAMANVALTIVWIGAALLILRPQRVASRAVLPFAPATAAAIALVLMAAPASAQESREAHLAAQRAEKSQHLTEYAIGHGRRLLVTPIATPSGTAAGFTWLGEK